MTSSLENPAEQLEEDKPPHRDRAELRSVVYLGLIWMTFPLMLNKAGHTVHTTVPLTVRNGV